jgi:mono/diheme cytochrome c family protein
MDTSRFHGIYPILDAFFDADGRPQDARRLGLADVLERAPCQRPSKFGLLMAAVLLTAAIAAASHAAAQAPLAPAPSRGELLYATHCIACHTTQVHWRQKKLATDWPSLKVQVRRWAANTGLAWTDEEVVDVARYLNATQYRFATPPGAELGLADMPTPLAQTD